MLIARTIAVVGLLALSAPSVGAASPGAGKANAAAPGAAAQRLASPFTVGEIFPDLAFPSLQDGTPKRLSDFRGHKVMLHVFASW